MVRLFDSSNIEISHTTTYTDLSTDNTKVQLKDEDKMAVKLVIKASDSIYSGDDIRDIFQIDFVHTSMRKINESIGEDGLTKMAFSKWTEYDFKGHNFEEKDLTNQYEYWFNFTNASIAGNLFNDNIYDLISISFRIWKEDKWTKDFKAKDTLMVHVFMHDQYVDLNDIDTPVKQIYHQVIYEDIVRSPSQYSSSYNIERNRLSLEKNWWDFIIGPNQRNFNTIELEKFQDNYSSVSYFQSFNIHFSLGRNTHIYRIKTPSILEAFWLIGGLLIIWELFWGIIPLFTWSLFLKNNLKKQLEKANLEIEKLNSSIQKLKNLSKEFHQRNLPIEESKERIELFGRVGDNQPPYKCQKIENSQSDSNNVIDDKNKPIPSGRKTNRDEKETEILKAQGM